MNQSQHQSGSDQDDGYQFVPTDDADHNATPDYEASNEPPEADAMVIPHDRLSPDALEALILEFVTRDGTELSDDQNKIDQVRRRLEQGYAVVTFDPDTETCNIVTTDSLPPRLRPPRPDDRLADLLGTTAKDIRHDLMPKAHAKERFARFAHGNQEVPQRLHPVGFVINFFVRV